MKKEKENIDLKDVLKFGNDKNGFKTPEGYFSELQNKLKDKLLFSDADSILSKIPKKNNFKIPNVYQSKLASELHADILGVKMNSKKGILRTMYWTVAAAAALWIGIVVVRSFERPANNVQLAAYNITVGDFEESEILEVETEGNPMLSYLGDDWDATFFEEPKITVADFQSSFEEEWDEEASLF